MLKKYSDSLYPFGIGTSFVVTLSIMMVGGLLLGLFLEPDNYPEQSGGIILLIIILVLVVGPIIYNKKVSRFEKDRIVLKKVDDIGMVQGLRGAFFRLLLYEDGLEVRAFYHRYYIPFAIIDDVSIEKGYLNNRLNIVTKIKGVPDHIISSEKKLLDFACLIEKRVKSNRANSADAYNHKAD